MADNARGIDLFTPDNPMSPYLAVKIDGKVFDLSVNFLKSLVVHRTTDNYGTFEFTIEDSFDLGLEDKFQKLILEVSNDFSFQYGWNKKYRDSMVTSPWYFGKIIDYTPSFRANLALSITVKGNLVKEDAQSHVTSYKSKNISDIVRQIAQSEGWEMVACVDADPLDEEMPFVQANVPSIDFIREKLEPEALKDGIPFHFYIDTSHLIPQAYFVPITMHVIEDKNYNFIINMGNYGNVISFEPAYNASTIAMGREQAGLLNIATNEISVYGSKASDGVKKSELAIYGSTTPDRMKALLTNKWFEKNLTGYKATLSVVGDPELMPMQYVNILPMRPDGTPHHTMGTYLIQEIEDRVDSQFISTLTLVKMSPGGDGKSLPLTSAVNLEKKE